MGSSPFRLRPPRRGMPVVPLVIALLVALGTACQPLENPKPMPSSSPAPTIPTSTSNLGTVSATETPSGASQPVSQQRMFDHTEVQDAVYSLLARTYQIQNVELVICPPNQPVERGSKFSCTAKIDGESTLVPITVTSAEGDYRVGRPR